jgi:hypothetical protein
MRANALSTSRDDVTSQRTNSPVPDAAARPASSAMSSRNTAAPASANAIAVARPMPVAAPVTATT